MQKRWAGWGATVLVAALAACGSEDDGLGLDQAAAHAPADLSEAHQVARAVAMLKLAQASDRQMAEFAAFRPALLGKSSAQAKLRIEDQCADGGDYVYDAPSGEEVIDIRFQHCRDGAEERHGAMQMECLEGSFADGSCVFESVQFGRDKDRFQLVDDLQRLQLSGVWTRREQDAFLRLGQSAQWRLEARQAERGLIFAPQSFELLYEDQGESGQLLDVDGRLGLNHLGEITDCTQGEVAFHTIERLILNDQAQIVGGELRLENSENDTAFVEFLSTGDLAVTIDGLTETVAADSYEAYCELSLVEEAVAQP